MRTLATLFRLPDAGRAAGERAFPAATLQAITKLISHGESVHRAEIKLVIDTASCGKPIANKRLTRQRAVHLFSQYRIWDTEENCGILVYLNLADRKVEIIADRCVNRALSPADWHAVCQIMVKGFGAGLFHDSVLAALEHLNSLLHEHFPSHGTRRHELSDKPLIL